MPIPAIVAAAWLMISGGATTALSAARALDVVNEENKDVSSQSSHTGDPINPRRKAIARPSGYNPGEDEFQPKKGILRSDFSNSGKESHDDIMSIDTHGYSPSVASLQGKLKELDRLAPGIGIDLGTSGKNKDGVEGHFGTLTRDSVIKVQSALGLEKTGVADAAFRKALDKEIKTLHHKTELPALGVETNTSRGMRMLQSNP